MHTLDFDLNEEPDFVQEVQEAPIDDASQEVDFSLFEQYDQVKSDFEALRDVEVEYETVYGHQEYDLDHNAHEDFTIIDTTELLRNIEVIAEEVLSTNADDYGDFAFELPLVVNNEDSDSEEQPRTVVFDLNEPIEEPKAAAPEATDETTVSPKIKTISAYELDFDDDFELGMTLKTKEVEEAATPSLSVNQKPGQVSAESASAQNSPYEMSLSETQEILAARKEQRIKVFKEFNHQFNAKTAKIEDFENVPAYKRAGVSFDEIPSDAKVSRTTLSDDSNGNQQIRSNNSFLHDNVD